MNSFIRSLIAFSLKNKFFIFFATALLVVAGVFSFMNTPIEAFPDMTNTNVVIVTQWPGRSSEEVERFVTIPIETEMNVIDKKTSLRSISLFGLSVVTMIFDDGVEDFKARVEVANRLSNVNLPDGSDAEILPPSGPTGEIFRYTLTSAQKDQTELKTIQDWIIDKEIKSVSGIADVVSFGGKVRIFEVSVNPGLLAKYEFSALDVYNAIRKANINVGGDVVVQGQQAFVVRGIGILQNSAEIEALVIDNRDGTPVRIKDVAVVRDTYQPRLGIAGRDTTDDVVEGIVLMRKGGNPAEVLEALHAKVAELNESVLPGDVKIKTFYDRTNLNNFTMHTVSENVFLGIGLVTLILLLFLADWRTTVTVAIVIPLALLFAFILMRIKGMSANLLSIGAIDFGIIIDGAVVMVEGIFVMLAHKAHRLGMEKYAKRAKMSSILKTATEMGKSIFISKLIIITALIPIFSFQKVEGKMFSPLAFTLGFALLGALIISLTLVPVLCSILLNVRVRERENPFINGMNRLIIPALDWVLKHPRKGIMAAVILLVISVFAFGRVGSEFLPHLNEGSIYVRATLPMSVSLSEGYHYTRKFRSAFKEFPEVRSVISQTGRPNDGTDPTGFFNAEFFVDLYPKDDWKRDITKDELVEQMQARLDKFPGISFNFSQPISDNVEEAVSGVKGSMAIKIIGKDLVQLERCADSVFAVMNKIDGVADLGVFRNLGQPELDINLDQQKMALYGVFTEDAQAVIETAIGGKTAGKVYEDERRFDIRIRYDEPYRWNTNVISQLRVPTENGNRIPLKEIAEIKVKSGPAFIYREGNKRFIAIKFSVRGRDLGSTIQEAQNTVAAKVKLPEGYTMKWNGEFENQQRATQRLTYVVPISIVVIFLILYIAFGSTQDAAIVLLNVPFALIGGILALLFTGVNFSISAGVGFIALFGVSVQNGVILVNIFKENLKLGVPLKQAVRAGTISRIRPVVMTALMASLGLLPAALSTGIGSETQKPLAIVVIGGLISATILVLLILPAIFAGVYGVKERREHRRKNGPDTKPKQ
ncbi:MAG: CusA/CzcA family heavy metal efflux RND transporter [Bacteroidota bacterium]